MILFIHRKDLRTHDLPAFDLIQAAGDRSLHVLILEPFLLRNGRHLEHSGINFLTHVSRLKEEYTQNGKLLHILYGEPDAIVTKLAQVHPVDLVLTHADYTPYALKREAQLSRTAERLGIRLLSCQDSMLCDLNDFMEWSGRSEPYKVFTPFYRRWRSFLAERYRPPYAASLQQLDTAAIDEETVREFSLPVEIVRQLDLLALSARSISPDLILDDFFEDGLQQYTRTRDQYALQGTSMVSRHLNTGAVSVRTVYSRLTEDGRSGEDWLRQLAWRDFYLYQARLDPDFFSYEKAYDLSLLSTDHFEAWSSGATGIPIIDAAMRQLNETGWMPNRLRMITAMFLTKNLGCPFIYGERYFRLKLTDYDNVLNRGGWLWSSSLGYDASPYFRVMNPVTQSQTHDPVGTYIRTWMPELSKLSDKEIHLPRPEAIVDLKRSRALAIDVYKEILRSKQAVNSG
ncbi:cryptochrome/photolyase family protein [Paenibacillus camerounensis]|uniref:cryptochrome/photolyase family protein n=1 Tax=Paenibacillus camerounensis TaxID=1243663 RepID=UPI0005A6A7E0|nr:deoxyribodipyrimidine photo-lyase [Paenibacillus camerounensis]